MGQYNKDIRAIFEFYAGYGVGNVGTMSLSAPRTPHPRSERAPHGTPHRMLEWMVFISDMNLSEPLLPPSKLRSMTVKIFLSSDFQDDGGSTDRSRPHSQQTAKTSTFKPTNARRSMSMAVIAPSPHGEDDEKDTQLNRTEFVEALLRLSTLKFPLITTLNERFQMLLSRHLMKHLKGNQLERMLRGREVQTIFERYHVGLSKIYNHYARMNSANDTKVCYVRLL